MPWVWPDDYDPSGILLCIFIPLVVAIITTIIIYLCLRTSKKDRLLPWERREEVQNWTISTTRQERRESDDSGEGEEMLNARLEFIPPNEQSKDDDLVVENVAVSVYSPHNTSV